MAKALSIQFLPEAGALPDELCQFDKGGCCALCELCRFPRAVEIDDTGIICMAQVLKSAKCLGATPKTK